MDDGNTLDAKATTAAALVAQKITYKEMIRAAGAHPNLPQYASGDPMW